MSASRRAAKVDGNQTAIVDALRAAGCSVQSLAAIGGGVPDLLVGTGKYWNVLLEVLSGQQLGDDKAHHGVGSGGHTRRCITTPLSSPPA